MRGRERLAFRSNLDLFCVPGVVGVLVSPVKTNGPLEFREKKKLYYFRYTFLGKFRYSMN